jgi:predicted nucleotidyltransferase
MSEFDSRKKYSEKMISALRERLDGAGLGNDLSVVVNGSFARREGSEQSDLDFYVLYLDEEARNLKKGRFNAVRKIVADVVKKEPSPDGAFATETSIEAMTKNIGGMSDRNEDITRRSLLLFEGDYLYGKRTFKKCRSELLKRYIRPQITDHQLALFLLNDLIRYYRTICVDFEFKTTEQNKPYGIRMIKLVFSRKLLFFGGVIVVAETAQRNYKEKLRTLQDLLALPPLERIQQICGPQSSGAVQLYNEFLEQLGREDVRKKLEKIKTQKAGRNSALFRELKNKGHRLSWELMALLDNTYHSSHPIHRSLIL